MPMAQNWSHLSELSHPGCQPLQKWVEWDGWMTTQNTQRILTVPEFLGPSTERWEGINFHAPTGNIPTRWLSAGRGPLVAQELSYVSLLTSSAGRGKDLTNTCFHTQDKSLTPILHRRPPGHQRPRQQLYRMLCSLSFPGDKKRPFSKSLT